MKNEERRPCAKCGCLASDIKHAAFGMRGFTVACYDCENRADGKTRKDAVKHWNSQFRIN